MGLMMSILFSYVGAVEVALVVRDVTHQVCLHNEQLQDDSADQRLGKLQAGLRRSIRQATQAEIAADEHLMQDGVAYENGYRLVEQTRGDRAAAERWQRKRQELSSSGSDDALEHRGERKAGTSSKHLTAKRSEETISPQSSMSADMPSGGGVHFDDDHEGGSGKYRPIVRDDGSGRRRAFKKRQQQSSASSTSSGDAPQSRTSREDELKMFTSLEEEEFEAMRRNEYTPMQYASGDLSMKAARRPQHQQQHHSHRSSRNRRSPDGAQPSATYGSDEGDNNENEPWGDVRPKHFHDSDLWRKERAQSIVEEHEPGTTGAAHDAYRASKRSPQMAAVQQSAGKMGQRCYSPVGDKKPHMAAFEEATDNEHEMVIDAMKRRHKAKHDMPRPTDDNRSSRGNQQKGANVSTDDDDDADDDVADVASASALPDVCPPARASITTAELDRGGMLHSSASHSSLDEEKLGAHISHIALRIIDDDGNDTGRPADEFREFADTSRRKRHTSYNNAVDGDDRDEADADLVINTGDTQLEARVNSQEERLRTIQAQIVRINNSLTPLTRDLLASESAYVVETQQQTATTVSSTSFMQHEITTEEHTRTINERPTMAAPSENVAVQSDPNSARKFVTMESITLSEAATTSSALDSPMSLNRELSWTSSDEAASSSRDYYGRSESMQEAESDLEYIRGRPDWRETRARGGGFAVKNEMDSDDYHHRRRYSECDDQLEFIRGRDDWNQQARRIGGASHAESSIRNEIDSDEYHHARRLSECLDLAYSARLLAARWKTGNDFERAVSESRDIAEERVIGGDLLTWSKPSTSRPMSRNLSPSHIHILIEDTSVANESGIERWQEVHMPELDAPSSAASSGWDLEQSYDGGSRRASVQHQNTLDEQYLEQSLSDQKADQEVADILASSNAVTALHEAIIENVQEVSVSDLSDVSADDDGHTGMKKMKKSKTTRNLLDAERLSVDLSANEAAVKAISDKSDELKLLKQAEKAGTIAENPNETFKRHEAIVARPKLAGPSISMPGGFRPVTSASSSRSVPQTPRTPSIDELLQETSIGPWFRKPPQENVDDLLQETSMGPWFHN